jgi:hypothetical protein
VAEGAAFDLRIESPLMADFVTDDLPLNFHPAATCTPLMTRRSSARSPPRTSVGRCGSIRFHCSSLSQNRFLTHDPDAFQKTNQDRIVRPEKLMSSDPRYSFTAQLAVLGSWAFCHSEPGMERCLLASATIKLASTANECGHNADLNDALEHATEDVALVEPLMAVTGEC